ncbi:MAG: multicopper oxidase domain-containing protein [Actinobacteria bacterium]|nr:multicopper oxidase domain-containing protein [Actinomycetota bacterium]
MQQRRVRASLRAGAGVIGAALAAAIWFGDLSGSGAGEAKASSSAPTMAGMTMATPAQHWADVGGARFKSDGVTRTYFISADKVVWNYAPDARNDITGKPFDDVARTYAARGHGRIGSRYLKCIYRGYTDAHFHRRTLRGPGQRYLGLLGPVIQAEVGDTIRIVFRNNCPFPTSMHPHGLLYTKASEGAPYAGGTTRAAKLDDAVPSGKSHIYTWRVPERAGPGPGDGSSVMWMYHSHANETSDTYAGLMGPIEITRRGMARKDGSPKDVDQQVFVLVSVMNENLSPFLRQNASTFVLRAAGSKPDDPEDFEESNLMHSINGYVFGNQPMITLRKGQRVRWYVMSMGTEVDLHTPHWHGNDVLVGGMRMDVVSLLPASMVVADMVPDNKGTWLFHCHVNDHIKAGMLTRYQVTT